MAPSKLKPPAPDRGHAVSMVPPFSRRTRRGRRGLLAIAAVGLAAVGALAAALASPAPPVRPVPFRTVAIGDGSSSRSHQRTGMVVKGERRWSKVWRSLRAEGRLPRIDFSRQMLLVASQGRQPSGGHLLRITGVEASGGALLVDVTEVSPGEGCITAGVITSPYHVVRVTRSDKPVRFRRHPKEKVCD
jgi:hypothetical protein